MRKKLVGDSGETLITPFRVSRQMVEVSCCYSVVVVVSVCTAIVEGGRADQILTQGEAAKDVLLGTYIVM